MAIENLIQRTPRISTKGSTIVHSGTATAELAVGSNSTYLIANSAASVGVNWATTADFASPAMEHIYSTTTTAVASEIDITSIPGTYGSLVLQISNANVTTAGTEASLKIIFNNISSGYYFIGGGYGVGNERARNTSSFNVSYALTAATATYSVDHGGMMYMNIGEYASNKHKSWTFQYIASNIPQFGSGTWSNTAAITSIKMFPTSGTTFKSGLKVTLFGTSI